ncbi:MAG: hypothetical protein P4M09_31320 [Devosia sp.]|nr:hypothetical protein [Devosia sp.]
MSSLVNSARPGRFVAALAMGLAMGLSGFSSVEAASGDGGDQVQHFFSCFDLMVTNGAQHAQECGPNSYVPADHPQLAPAGGGGVVCSPVGMVRLPLGAVPKIASLGDGAGYALPPIEPSLLLAYPNPCAPHCGMLSRPLFAPFEVASLEVQLDAAPRRRFGPALHAAGC